MCQEAIPLVQAVQHLIVNAERGLENRYVVITFRLQYVCFVCNYFYHFSVLLILRIYFTQSTLWFDGLSWTQHVFSLMFLCQKITSSISCPCVQFVLLFDLTGVRICSSF